MRKLELDLCAGDHILRVAQHVVSLVAADNLPMSFDFNDITLTVMPSMTAADVCAEYNRICKEHRAAYLLSAEYKERQKRAEEREQQRTTSLAAALANAPEKMTLRDPEGWASACRINPDGYGGAIMSYAELWARVMEGMIASGATVEGCAKEASRLADSEGITGFMYGCAVSTLSEVWIYGETLRRWHNLDTQIGNEGEKANEKGTVLNPALLGLG